MSTCSVTKYLTYYKIPMTIACKQHCGAPRECLTTDSDHSEFDVMHSMKPITFRTTVSVSCENCEITSLRDWISIQLEKRLAEAIKI